MKILFIVLLTLLPCFKLWPQSTKIMYLSGTDAANTVEWEFFCTDGNNSGKWTTIPVPSNWELQGFGTYNYGHDWSKKELGKEHGLYRYNFDIPDEWKGKTINIVFDGSMTDTEVKINGKLAGEIHQGAFYRFKYDITKLLKYGQNNLLEVDVAKHSANVSVNKAERQADFWIFGGIFRPVFLEVLPPVHINRIALDPKADGTLTARITTNKFINGTGIQSELFDLEGNSMEVSDILVIENGAMSAELIYQFGNIESWNPEHPHLYDLKVRLTRGDEIMHEITERIGFRTVEFREYDGFYVNGKKVVFKGVNRHSFWPETGRCLAEKHHRTDIEIMKGMNMNAVRMSHYIPDKRFLELCDSLGLFVLNEITGWQDAYDLEIGSKVIPEAVIRDHNHPCVVIWDNGNEGGWLFENEQWFHANDIQDRPVLYPWLQYNGTDTYHYSGYDPSPGRLSSGVYPFMPTEFLHGLYDGGHGAGLNDFWNRYQNSPLHAGGFLWVLADEALLRNDKPGTVYDSDGNHAPDGIVGPHREKEGSYFTIREIWSPIQIKPIIINRNWNGHLFVENKFIYTDLSECSLEWETQRISYGKNAKVTITGNGKLTFPDTEPHETVRIDIPCTEAIQQADLFVLTAFDHQGNAVNTWSWNVLQPQDIAARIVMEKVAKTGSLEVLENNGCIEVKANGMEYAFDKASGNLTKVMSPSGVVSLTGGALVAGVEAKVINSSWQQTEQGKFIFIVEFDTYPHTVRWEISSSGLLFLEASSPKQHIEPIDFLGISFNYPEEKCESITWMGAGPYRIWKNRTRGNPIGLWSKAYNNTITGESFNSLVYPEFKGYHGNLFWMELTTSESPIHIITETPNLYFQLYTPAKPQHVKGGTYPSFPDADISFLQEIPAIGTKFKNAEYTGPQGQKVGYYGHKGDQGNNIKLWFDFLE